MPNPISLEKKKKQKKKEKEIKKTKCFKTPSEINFLSGLSFES